MIQNNEISWYEIREREDKIYPLSISYNEKEKKNKNIIAGYKIVKYSKSEENMRSDLGI